MIVFDIETEGLPDDQLASVCKPFDPESIPRPGEFDVNAVKTGHLKDEMKISAKLHEAKKAHEKEVASYDDRVKAAEQAHWAAIRDKAALDATTGRVVAIGYMNDTGKHVIHDLRTVDEARILREFWTQFAKMREARRSMVGFYSNRFDVPFICRRSWMIGVQVPSSAFTPTGYLSPTFVDLADKWRCGDRMHSINLDTLAKALGAGCKPSDCTGADFARMLLSNNMAEQNTAIDYLIGDLRMTLGCAMKLL
jgi:uncharacterized protein YprB with RNaseH-like and TPR domain